MKVTVNVDCTPEEARSFLGLPDVTAINEKYVETVLHAMDGTTSLEQMQNMFKSLSPMGDASLRLFKQMMDIGLGATGSGGSTKGSE